ncbi:MAG: hypothetical protein HY673_12235 [Chloroflexi bacterium]|nr:hypothetical protein [Chloroflexota bacterium]
MDKVCVVLGAGASADVRGRSSPIKELNVIKPPLARELFDFDVNGGYRRIIEPYGGASFLAQRLGVRAESLGTKFDIEHELRELADHKEETVRRKFGEIPAYLCDLLAAASYGFTYWPTHYDDMLITLLADHPHDVLFLVLNYDTFLEQAISAYDEDWKFNTVHDYVGKNRTAKVIKLHGSVNWFKLIGSADRNWGDLIVQNNVLWKVEERLIHVFENRDPVIPVRTLTIDHNHVYPIMTAPLAGKGINAMVCPDSHLEVAKTFLKGCRKVLIIGSSGRDEDLVELLDSLLDPTSKCLYNLVGSPALEVGYASERFAKGVRALAKSSKPGCMFNAGLGDYVHGRHLEEFASAKI